MKSTLPTHRNQALQPTDVESRFADRDGNGVLGGSISNGDESYLRIKLDIKGRHVLLVGFSATSHTVIIKSQKHSIIGSTLATRHTSRRCSRIHSPKSPRPQQQDISRRKGTYRSPNTRSSPIKSLSHSTVSSPSSGPFPSRDPDSSTTGSAGSSMETFPSSPT